jgi:glycosyltransferase involved in cell wall biosynthesis
MATARDTSPRPGRGAGATPSVLAVTSEPPWPLDTGGHLRTFHLLRALTRRYRVRLVTATSPGSGPAVDALRGHGIDVCPAPVAPRSGWREALRAAAASSRGEPYVLYRRHDRPEIRAALRLELDRESPDLLYLDHLDSLVFRRLAPSTPAIVDLHNVYSKLARRTADERSSPWSRQYLRREARLLERVERRAAKTADRLTVVSEEDSRHFRMLGATAIEVVPNGVDCAAYRGLPTGRAAREPTILYVGAMSWGPNVSAAVYLAEAVLPLVRDRVPGTRLRIVGRDPAPSVRSLGRLPGVEVTGAVPDVTPHLRAANVLAVPLEAGGGTRLKILEAFAAGLPVVSTPVGCEGLGADDGEHLVIADRDGFAEAVVALLRDETLGRRLAARARDLSWRRFDWGTIGDAACDAVEATLATPRVRNRPDAPIQPRTPIL